MSVQQTFRSALNGFNRDDVIKFIDSMNSKHSTLVNQLTTEAEFLRGKLSHFQSEVEAEKDTAEELALTRQEVEELKAQLEQRDARIAELEEPREEESDRTAELEAQIKSQALRITELETQLETRMAQIEAMEASAAQPAAQAPAPTAEELECYRRAEQTERRAKEHAAQLYHQANGAIADATVRVDEAAAGIAALAEQITEQLDALKQAVDGSKQSLQQAGETLCTIRPDSE